MSEDYEKKYKDLKQEYDQSQLDNDEICKEYESTIKMLTDSLESIKTEKINLENQISLLEQDQKNLEKEKESLVSRNKEKISDMQNLNKQIEKLKSENKKMKDDKNLVKERIISLEKDNDHYQNQIRQDKALIDDLKDQLEFTLEENITLQTEFELYKQKNEETLIRKEQEIKDYKNDIINKEKIIQRLNDKRNNNLKELKQKLLLPKEIIDQYQRKMTNTIFKGSTNKDTLEIMNPDELNKNEKINNSIILYDKMVTPLTETNPQYPPKFMEIYRKSLKEDDLNNLNNKDNNETLLKDDNIKESILIPNNNSEINNNNKDNDNPLLRLKTLKDSRVINPALEGIETDEKNNKEENEDDDSVSDKKCFEDLVICDEKDFNIIPIKKLMNENKNNRDKKLADNLRNMLVRIQKRKDVLMKNQKNNNLKLAKLGYKLDIKL